MSTHARLVESLPTVDAMVPTAVEIRERDGLIEPSVVTPWAETDKSTEIVDQISQRRPQCVRG